AGGYLVIWIRRRGRAPIGTSLASLFLENRAHQETMVVLFLDVNMPSAYNLILRRHAQNTFQAVVSTYHMKLKFPVGTQVGKVKECDVFAWLANDLVGIDPRILVHHLNLNPAFLLVKQKKRHFGLAKDKVIQVEGMDIMGPFPISFFFWLLSTSGWKIQDQCVELGIQQRFTTIAYPQANGQVEVTNSILVQGIKVKLEQTGGQWVDALLGVPWSYRTTHRSTTGETSFNLVYGSEAEIPARAELQTFII
ncbi:hypothetical protein Sango_2771000, partial [Sesamum angolense]